MSRWRNEPHFSFPKCGTLFPGEIEKAPFIVIDSPLFECSRKQDGELELIEVSNSEFLFSAHIPDYIGCSVKVITKEHLPDFA